MRRRGRARAPRARAGENKNAPRRAFKRNSSFPPRAAFFFLIILVPPPARFSERDFCLGSTQSCLYQSFIISVPSSAILRCSLRDLLSDELGFDRQFAVASIDEHGKLNRPHAAKVAQSIEGARTVRPVLKNIVDEHHVMVVDAGAALRFSARQVARQHASDHRDTG